MNAIVIQFPDRQAAGARAGRARAGTPHRDDAKVGLSPDRLDDDPCPYCWAVRAHAVVDEIQSRLDAGDAEDVVGLCQRAVCYLEASSPEIEEVEPLEGLARRLDDLHLRACTLVRPEPVALARWLFDAELGSNLGAFADAAERYAGALGRTGLAEYRRIADAAWRGPKRRSDIQRSVDEFRLRPIMASIARARHPSAV